MKPEFDFSLEGTPNGERDIFDLLSTIAGLLKRDALKVEVTDRTGSTWSWERKTEA